MSFNPDDPTPFVRSFDVIEDDPTSLPVGTTTFERHGLFLHAMTRRRDGDDLSGLAAVFGSRLVMAFGPLNKVEIGAYRAEGDRLEGIWIPPGAKGSDLGICGRERSRRESAGQWRIEEARSIDGSTYSGKLTVTSRDSAAAKPFVADFLWTLHDGVYHSFGLVLADAMFSTFCFEPDKPHGIAVYEASSPMLLGTLLDNVSRKPRTQWLRPTT